MKKILFFLAIAFSFYILISLYSLDRYYFLSPLEYKGDIIIRSDSRGNGLFASPRQGNRAHKGIDLLASVGEPVKAARFGWVVAAGRDRGLGNYIAIRHSDNLLTIYGHLGRLYVKKGNFVRQGSVIASVGRTGNARYNGIQPHLHFEVRKHGIPQDPMEYLK